MNRITVRNADIPGTMRSMVMDTGLETQLRFRKSSRVMSFKQLW